MNRRYEDPLGTTWDVVLAPAEAPDDDIEEEMLLRFTAEGEDDREIHARGAIEESFEELTEDDLQVALEAAGNGLGFVFLHPEEGLWWVRRADEDPLSDGAPITFSNQTDEHHYAGRRAGDPTTMTEDELQEALDEARGVTSP